MMQRFAKIVGIASICSFATLGGAYAQTTSNPPNPQAQSQPVKLVYDIYNKGLHVISVNANYVLTPTTYKVNAHFFSAGLGSLVFTLDSDAVVDGVFKNGQGLPGVYQSTGKDKNGDFKLVMNSHYGLKTDIMTLDPARGNDRDALTADQQTNSLDMLSAMADLMHRVNTTGKCDAQFNLLDGLRSFTFRSQTAAGESDIPSNWGSPYQGKALLCQVVAQQVGGFKTHSRHRALLAQPQPGYIWFQKVADIGYLPVRFDFKNPKMGMVTGILQKVPVNKK